jgi:hypothetical protein
VNAVELDLKAPKTTGDPFGEISQAGMTAVGDSAATAQEAYERAERILLAEARAAATPRPIA